MSLVLAGAVALVPLSAQESSSESPGGVAGLLAGFDLGLGVGATAFSDLVDDGAGNMVLTTTTYQKVSLSPDLNFGKFGIGLDITFHVNFSGGPTGDKYFRSEDWVPAEFAADSGATGGEKVAALAELYLGKFRYVSWGARGEPLYVKFGMIDDGNLGNGFLMGNYANTLYLPETRILGLAFGLDGSLFKFPLIGVETFVGNLARFDVFGGRLYVRPLVFTSIPILKNLSVGATLVADRNPYLYGGETVEAPTSSPVIGLGVDLQQPILATPIVSLAAFADWGMVTTTPAAGEAASGMGAMLGIGGKLISFLTYGAQIRLVGPRFVPVYFDSMYDLGRAGKYQTLIAAETATARAFAQWMASMGTSFLDGGVIFRLSASGPFVPPVDVDGVEIDNSELSAPQVKGIFKVEADFLRGFSFLATYEKKNIDGIGWDADQGQDVEIGLLRDLVSPEDAVIQARINYKSGPAVISFVYNLKYLPEPVLNDQGVEKRWEVSSGLETSIQLF